jgi:protease I
VLAIRLMENACAIVSDEPCVVDGNLITARFPYDLPRMVRALVAQLLPSGGTAA